MQLLYEHGWVRAIVFCIAYFMTAVIGGGVCILLVSALGFLMEGAAYEVYEVFENVYLFGLFHFGTFLFTLLLVYLFRVNYDRDTVYSLGFAWRGWEMDALRGFLGGVCIISVGFGLLWLLGNLTIIAVSWNFPMLLFYIFLFSVVAINEELLVRGYILRNLMDSISPFWSVLLSALFFGVLHSTNDNVTAIGILNIVLAGVLLGVYYVYRQNLWFPIMLHLSWNYFQGGVYGFEVSGLDFYSIIQQEIQGVAWLTGGDFGFEGSLLLTALMVGSIGGLWWWLREG